MQKRTDTSAGFSLIEVTLAIFVVGLGLLTLFALFPAGLNQATSAQDDTQVALFAEHYFSEMRARVANPTPPSGIDWEDASTWTVLGRPVITSGPQSHGNWPVAGRHIRYWVELREIDQDVWGIRLFVNAGEFGTIDPGRFKDGAVSFYTELVRMYPPVAEGT